jgi:hypothetical protein
MWTQRRRALKNIIERRKRTLTNYIACKGLQLGRKQRQLLRVLSQSYEKLPENIDDLREEIDDIIDEIKQDRIELDKLKSYGDLQDVYAWRDDGGPWHINKIVKKDKKQNGW